MTPRSPAGDLPIFSKAMLKVIGRSPAGLKYKCDLGLTMKEIKERGLLYSTLLIQSYFPRLIKNIFKLIKNPFIT